MPENFFAGYRPVPRGFGPLQLTGEKIAASVKEAIK
jgi:hypothetical protein